MTIQVHISDPRTGKSVVTAGGGALAVAPVHPSLSFNAELGTDDTSVNIVPAKADHVFCMTGLLLTANQNVSNTASATVNIYTATLQEDGVGSAITTLFTVPIGRNDTRDITGILVESEEATWINGETTDDDVFVTILGYYLKVI